MKRIVEENCHNNYKNLKKSTYFELKLPLLSSHRNHSLSRDDIDVKLPLSAIEDRIYAFQADSGSCIENLIKNESKTVFRTVKDMIIDTNLSENGETTQNELNSVGENCYLDEMNKFPLNYNCNLPDITFDDQKSFLLRSGDDIDDLNSAWYPPFFTCTKISEDEVCGWVKDELELDFLLDRHQKVTGTKFREKMRHISRSCEANKLYSKRHDIPAFLHPFSINYRDIHYCINRKLNPNQNKNENSSFEMKNKNIESCNARIVIRSMNIYSGINHSEGMTSIQRRKSLLDLRAQLAVNKDLVPKSLCIYVTMPMKKAHSDYCRTLPKQIELSQSVCDSSILFQNSEKKINCSIDSDNSNDDDYLEISSSISIKHDGNQDITNEVDIDESITLISKPDDFIINPTVKKRKLSITNTQAKYRSSKSPKIIPVSINDIDSENDYTDSNNFVTSDSEKQDFNEEQSFSIIQKTKIRENNHLIQELSQCMPNCLDVDRLLLIRLRLEECIELCKYTDIDTIMNHEYKPRNKTYKKKRRKFGTAETLNKDDNCDTLIKIVTGKSSYVN